MRYVNPVGPQGPANAYGYDYVDKNAGAGIAGSFVAAEAFTSPLSELAGLITANGITPSASDNQQVLRAVRRQRLNFIQAASVGGTANAVTLAFTPTFAALADLVGTPLVFLAKFTNTGAVTVTIDGLTATALTWPDGTALAAGDIALGATVILRYDGTAFRLQYCLSPTQVRALSGAANPISVAGWQLYKVAGTSSFTVPAGVTKVRLTVGGAGGGGGGGNASVSASGGTAGAVSRGRFTVVPGATHTVTVGAGGAGGAGGGGTGGTGGTSSFGSLLSCLGGNGGVYGGNVVGGPAASTAGEENWVGFSPPVGGYTSLSVGGPGGSPALMIGAGGNAGQGVQAGSGNCSGGSGGGAGYTGAGGAGTPGYVLVEW